LYSIVASTETKPLNLGRTVVPSSLVTWRRKQFASQI